MEKVKKDFEDYFLKPVAIKAASSLKRNATIKVKVDSVSEFYLVKSKSNLGVFDSASTEPEMTFTMSESTSRQILDSEETELGQIGIDLAKLVFQKKLNIEIHAGFLKLFRMGYFGIISKGGSAFTSFLATKGFNGVTAFKKALGR